MTWFSKASPTSAPTLECGVTDASVVDEGATLRCFVDVRGRNGNGCFLIRLAKGSRTHSDIASALARHSLYERYTSAVALELLRPGDWTVDVGAHAGYYSLLFAALIGEGGRVFAFEPNLDTYQYLLGNAITHPYATIAALPVALSDSIGQAIFHINRDNEGESALWDVSQFEHFAATHRAPSTQPTVVLTLDRVFELVDPRPIRLVKIDAEGAEAKILAGANEFFARFQPDAVICEINAFALTQCSSSESDVRTFFRALGYEPYVINLIERGEFDLCNGHRWRRLADDESIVSRAIYNLLFLRAGIEIPS